MHSALSRREPPIDVSMAAVKTWWQKYKHGVIQYSVSNAKDLHDKYGDIVKSLAVSNSSAYLLVKALRNREPAVYISDAVARQWLKQHFNLSSIENAGHLESRYGDLLREHIKQHPLDAAGVSQWLAGQHQVSVFARICQHWFAKDWSSSGMLMTPEAVEESMGVRLRLDEYRYEFADNISAEQLSQVFAESQPAVLASGMLLRQWYTKYHPDSGPLEYETTEALENAQGDHLRSVYPGLSGRLLRTALHMRRKVILVSKTVCREWVAKYASKVLSPPASSSVLKRPGAVSSFVLKRPAAVKSSMVLKRPAAAVDASTPPLAKRYAASPSSASSVSQLVKIEGATRVEAEIGQRYRQQLSDLGLGVNERDMQRRLLAWGFDATQRSCRKWLERYRLGDGARDGSVSVYVLSRQDLQRWHYVDGLTPQQLVAKYRVETGIFAHADNVVQWLKAPAQQLLKLENNVDMHSHACGEYVLDELQRGAKPADVAQQLLSKYLIDTTAQRVSAYRYYREQLGNYWTCDKLERSHWAFLYGHVSVGTHLSGKYKKPRTDAKVTPTRGY